MLKINVLTNKDYFMYKKSPPKDKENVLNKEVSTKDGIVLPVPTELPEQQTLFSLVATSSISSPAQALIFSMESHLEDTVSSITMPHQKLAKFLNHIGSGEQDQAEDMLKQYPGLSLKFGDLTDCSKREFKKISAFQYALWALDFHMWQMILKYLPVEEAIKQINSSKHGTWLKTKQTQVNWQKLIDALQIYIDNYNVWSYQQLKDYWSQKVGGAQLSLPAHVINEYFHPLRTFYSKFIDEYELVLPRNGVDTWLHANQSELMQLGENFAWSRGNQEQISALVTSEGEIKNVDNMMDKDYLKQLLLFRREQARMLVFVLSHQRGLNLKPH